ncbi:hypothetical protein ACHWQZ_G015945 [Mnemiopsis leidyi]
MRFAPPKSAPPETRKFSKDAQREVEEDFNISGWVIKPVQPDITLLRECLNTAPRRCSSATERTSCGQLIVNFGRVSSNRLKQKCSVTDGGITTRTRSKDSGVDGLTDSGVDNMLVGGPDSSSSVRQLEEDEFSDISESNDGSLDNEPELARLMVSEPELGEISELTSRESRDLRESRDVIQPPPHDIPVSEEHTQLSDSELATSLQTYVRRNSVLSRDKRKAKVEVERVEREHQLPTAITPDIPEVAAPPKQPLWSRSRKLERHSTSPSICSYNEVCVYDGKKSPDRDPFINTFDNVLPNNRPPYRHEKRRSSNSIFKSSCSIPSFSTPNQALLLIGMKPSNKSQQDNLNKTNIARPALRKPSIQKPPIMNKNRSLMTNKHPHLLQLPELGVNGSGDLVIRKKQIISG